eukprot:sb/3476424/
MIRIRSLWLLSGTDLNVDWLSANQGPVFPDSVGSWLLSCMHSTHTWICTPVCRVEEGGCPIQAITEREREKERVSEKRVSIKYCIGKRCGTPYGLWPLQLAVIPGPSLSLSNHPSSS